MAGQDSIKRENRIFADDDYPLPGRIHFDLVALGSGGIGPVAQVIPDLQPKTKNQNTATFPAFSQRLPFLSGFAAVIHESSAEFLGKFALTLV